MSSMSPRFSLAMRSYGVNPDIDRHSFTQLVLPISGTLTLDIAGQGRDLEPSWAAFVDTGTGHATMSRRPNRSLILDLETGAVPPDMRERLAHRPFVELPPQAIRLVDYMRMVAEDGDPAPPLVAHWVPLLLDTLVRQPPRPASRLAALRAAIEAAPGSPWTTGAMADHAAVSVSRLHALFRAELDTTPRAWLAGVRLDRVREWLRHTDRPIAEIAFAAGYADQSALTRAMRRATGLTPAAYRRQNRETRPRNP